MRGGFAEAPRRRRWSSVVAGDRKDREVGAESGPTSPVSSLQRPQKWRQPVTKQSYRDVGRRLGASGGPYVNRLYRPRQPEASRPPCYECPSRNLGASRKPLPAVRVPQPRLCCCACHVSQSQQPQVRKAPRKACWFGSRCTFQFCPFDHPAQAQQRQTTSWHRPPPPQGSWQQQQNHSRASYKASTIPEASAFTSDRNRFSVLSRYSDVEVWSKGRAGFSTDEPRPARAGAKPRSRSERTPVGHVTPNRVSCGL